MKKFLLAAAVTTFSSGMFAQSDQLFPTADPAATTVFSDTSAQSNQPFSNSEPNKNFFYRQYPNPVKDILYIEFNKSLPSFIVLFVYDATGRFVNIGLVNIYSKSMELDVANIPTGIYYYEIRTKEEIARNIFVKE